MKDISSMLYNADDSDVIIQVGHNEDTEEFYAHKVILCARSPYFKSAFSDNWAKRRDNMIMFSKPNITPTVFGMILTYYYTGELDLSKQSGEDILELLVASDELLVGEFFDQYIQDYLIKIKSSWIQENFVLVLHTTFKHANCKKLLDYCLESICEDPQPFITSEAFSSLDKSILFDLLKRDDLQIKTVVVWDSLIKWGINQTPELKNKNRDEWTVKSYEDLKNTLNDLIPLIKFLNFTSEEFNHEVRPYKEIVPKNIYEEAMTHYLVKQPREREMEIQYSNILMPTNIIKPNIANIIANWIDSEDSAVLSPNNNYKFNLIYLMSRDGLNDITFHNKCSKQGPLVVLVRVQSKKIFGGYNPISYASGRNQWSLFTKSFIFSFENDRDTRNMKIGRVISANYIVPRNVTHLFNFGGQLFYRNQNLHLKNSGKYNSITGSLVLPIDEIEVFSVVKIE